MDNFSKIKNKIKRYDRLSKLVFIPFLLVFIVPITYGFLGGSFNWIIFLVVGFLFVLVMLSAYFTTALESKILATFKNEITKPILAEFYPEWKLDVDLGMERGTIDSLEFLRSKYGDLYTGNSVSGKCKDSFFRINDISLSTTYPPRGENDSSKTVVHYRGSVFMMELGDVIMNPVYAFSGHISDYSDDQKNAELYENKGVHLKFENGKFAKSFTVFSHNEGIRDIFDATLQNEFLELLLNTKPNIRIVLSGAKIYITLQDKFNIWELSKFQNEEDVQLGVKENVELIECLVRFSENFTKRVFETKDIWQK